jgi:uncharacterized protein (DUF2267 family)
MDFDHVVDHVKAEVGVERRAHAERAVAEFLEVLSEALDEQSAITLMQRLPPEVRPVLGEPHAHAAIDVHGLVAHLSEHMQLDPVVALRLAVATATALAVELDAEARAVLRERLHPTIAALFDAPLIEHAPA